MKTQNKKRFVYVLCIVFLLSVFAFTGSSLLSTQRAKASEGLDLSSFVLNDAASIRTDEPCGIRFEGSISQNQYSSLPDNAVIGVLIKPTQLVDGELDLEENDVENVVIERWKDDSTTQTKKFFAALVGGETLSFPKEFYNESISARAYVKYTDNEQIEHIKLSDTVNRSIAYVAGAALADGMTEDTTFIKSIVDDSIESVSFEKETYVLGVGDAINLKLVGDNGIPAIFTCDSNCSISNGVLTANSVGDCTVTATLGTTTTTATVKVLGSVDTTGNMVSENLLLYMGTENASVEYVEGVELEGQIVNAIKITSPESESTMWTNAHVGLLKASLFALKGQDITRLYMKVYVVNGSGLLRDVGKNQYISCHTGYSEHELNITGTHDWALNGLGLNIGGSTTAYITDIMFKPPFDTSDMINEETLSFMLTDVAEVSYVDSVELNGQTVNAIKIQAGNPANGGQWGSSPDVTLKSDLFNQRGTNTRLYMKLHIEKGCVRLRNIGASDSGGIYKSAGEHGIVLDFEGNERWALDGIEIHMDNGSSVYITELSFRPAFNINDMVNEETASLFTENAVNISYVDSVELESQTIDAIKITAENTAEDGWGQTNYALLSSNLMSLKGTNSKLYIKLYADCHIVLADVNANGISQHGSASKTGYIEITIDFTTATCATSGIRICIGNGNTATVYITELKFMT